MTLSAPQTPAASATATSHPIHTRMIEVELLEAGPGRYRSRGSIVDLRKRGFVPMAAELQGAGFIHHMTLDLEIDAGTRRVESVDVTQPYIAFEASEASGGECCRDPAPRLQVLSSAILDAEFARSASRAFGGALGCSHLLTLAQTVGRSLPFAIEREQMLQNGGAAPRLPGERIFKRTVFIDGLHASSAQIEIAVQLSDLHTAPRATLEAALDRLEIQEEVRASANIALEGFALDAVQGCERTRDRGTLQEAGWRDCGDELEPLAGRGIVPGLGSELFARFGDREERRLLLDTLLHLAPGFIQSVAALTDTWLSSSGPPPAYVTTGGGSDACYMWRRGGGFAAMRSATVASHKARQPADPNGEDAP